MAPASPEHEGPWLAFVPMGKIKDLPERTIIRGDDLMNQLAAA